jgi:hypothetical protein
VASSHWDLEVLAAGLRRHSGDLSLYAGFLLNTLSSALPPEMVRIERRGGLLSRLRGGTRVMHLAEILAAEEVP